MAETTELRKRQRRYSDPIADKIVAAIREGSPNVVAYDAAGVPERTFYRWLKDRPEFMAKVAMASAQFQQTCLKVIREAAPKDWHAAAWLLERRFPGEYALHVRVDATQRVREMADALGLDGDDAVAEIERMLAATPA